MDSTATALATSIPRPFIPFHEVADPTYNDAFAGRACIGNNCIPCPVIRHTWGEKFVKILVRQSWLAVIVVVLQVLLLLTYAKRPQWVTNRTVHTISLTFLWIALFSSSLFTLTESQFDKTACYDDITAASGLHNWRCGISGFLWLVGCQGSRMWMVLWAFDTHLQVIWDKQVRQKWVWLVAGFGVPLSLGFAGVPWQQFALGPTCQPETGKPLLYLVEVPYVVLDLLSGMIQVATLVGIVYRLSRHMARDGHSRRSLAARARHALAAPIVKSIQLFWRPLVLVFSNTTSTLLIVAGLYSSPVAKTRSGVIPDAWRPTLLAWYDCVLENQDDMSQCSHIILKKLNYGLYLHGLMYIPFLYAVFFDLVLIRWELLIVAFHDRQKRHISRSTEASHNAAMSVADDDALLYDPALAKKGGVAVVEKCELQVITSAAEVLELKPESSAGVRRLDIEALPRSQEISSWPAPAAQMPSGALPPIPVDAAQQQQH